MDRGSIAAGDQPASRLQASPRSHPGRSAAARRKKNGRARPPGDGDDAPLPLRAEPVINDNLGEGAKKGMNKW